MGMRFQPDPRVEEEMAKEAELLMQEEGMPNVPRDPVAEIRKKKLMEEFLRKGGGPSYGFPGAEGRIHPSQNMFNQPLATPEQQAKTSAALRFAAQPTSEMPMADQNKPVPTIERENDADQLVDRPSDLPGTSDNPKPPQPGDENTWPGEAALRDSLMEKAQAPTSQVSSPGGYSPQYIEALKDSSRTNSNLGLMALLARSSNQMGAIGGKVADSSGAEGYAQNLQGINNSSLAPITALEQQRMKAKLPSSDPSKLMLELLKLGVTERGTSSRNKIAEASLAAQIDKNRNPVAPPLNPVMQRKVEAEIENTKANTQKLKQPGSGKPVSAGAAETDMFRKRIESANSKYESLMKNNPTYDPSNGKDRFASAVGPLANGFKSEIGQLADQYEVEFIRANLRDESGAAIGVKEALDQAAAYFPRFGDTKARIQEKAAARKVLIDAMKDSYAAQTGGSVAPSSAATSPSKPKTIRQNGHTYTLNPETGEYE